MANLKLFQSVNPIKFLPKASTRNRNFLFLSATAFALAGIATFFWLRQDKISQWIPLTTAFLISLLLLSLCLWFIILRVKQKGTVIDGSVIIWTGFCVTYPLSAAVHLSGFEYKRGFYELVSLLTEATYRSIYYSLFLIFIAMIGLAFGLRSGEQTADRNIAQIKVIPRILLLNGLIFTIFGIFGTIRLATESPSIIEGLFIMDSTRQIGGGLARFFFMSEWVNWGIIYLFIFLLRSNVFRSKIVFSLFVLFSLSLLISNLFWTGARTAALVAILPFLFVLQKINISYSRIAIIPAILFLIVYISIATFLRSEDLYNISPLGKLLEIFDWQMGRFPMLGLALEIVERQGLAYGITMLHNVVDVINVPFILLKSPIIVNVPQGTSSMVGGILLGNPQINSIVPGSIFDLYFNFGLFGVLVGYFVIGYLVGKCTNIMRKINSLGTFCLASYTVTLIGAYFFQLEATSWIYYLATGCVPIMSYYVIERLFKAS